MYCDVVVSSAKFSGIFLASIEPAVRTREVVRPMTRRPTKKDERDFRAWAKELHEKRGYGPSREEALDFAREHRLNRNWARSQIVELPVELRRQRGGDGSTKPLSKARAGE
jgi:hypothetical protein